MTPKEKANELFNSYWSYLRSNLLDDTEAFEDAKVCSIKAVDEIIKVCKDAYDEEILSLHIIYWTKVKQEIVNL